MKSKRVPQESPAWDNVERKRLEQALHASEERFRTLVQLSFDVYWETDVEHRFTQQAFAPTLFNAPVPGSELGKTRWEVPYLDPDEEAWRRHRETLAAHLPFRDFELCRPTAGGGRRYVSVSGFPVFDADDGRFLGYRGVGRDVTERKRAEVQQRAHLGFLQSMDRISHAIQGSHNLERMLSDVLDAALDLFACDRAWLVHPCDQQLATWRADMERTRPPCPAAPAAWTDVASAADLAALFTAAQSSSDAVLSLPAPMADRYAIRSHMAMALHPKGDHPYLLCLHQCSQVRTWTDDEQRLFREICGRLADALSSKRAEEDLRASEARFRTFVDRATDAFFLLDDQLTVIDVNRQACEGLGYARDELIGMHPRDLDATLDEQSIVRLAERSRAGETITFETQHRRRDGTLFPVEIRSGMFRQGDRMFYLALARDITERKLAEERLREQDHALQTARAALAHVSRLTTLGELTTSIAHEVSQPLGGMITSAGACARWLAAQPPDITEARAALDNIAADGKRAREVIARIRALTKRQLVRKDRLDINQELVAVLALTEHEARSHRIVRRTELDRTLPRVPGDRIQLQQVLLNLIINAIEAMDAVGDRPRLLTIVSRHESPDAILVEVRDTGTGLDPQHIQQVFEAFYTTKEDGIGIGLSISRSIVEAHGGRLWASPNEPHGAVFRLTLPVAPAEERP